MIGAVPPISFPGRDVEQIDGRLEDAQPDELLDQVAARDHDVEARDRRKIVIQ